MLGESHLSDHRRSESPVRHKRAPRRRQSAFARYGSSIHSDETRAAEIVAQMAAAGATFSIVANADRRHFQYSIGLKPGADVDRCESLLAQVRADDELLRRVRVELFVAIVREAWDLPARCS